MLADSWPSRSPRPVFASRPFVLASGPARRPPNAGRTWRPTEPLLTAGAAPPLVAALLHTGVCRREPGREPCYSRAGPRRLPRACCHKAPPGTRTLNWDVSVARYFSCLQRLALDRLVPRMHPADIQRTSGVVLDLVPLHSVDACTSSFIFGPWRVPGMHPAGLQRASGIELALFRLIVSMLVFHCFWTVAGAREAPSPSPPGTS